MAVNPIMIVGLALGMRHGTDPDHLAAIDGLSRIRPSKANGVFFALGHGLVVTLLAVGVGRILAGRLEFLGPWTLILIGLVNLWRLAAKPAAYQGSRRPIIAQPFLLGMVLAAGFETASQLSALIVAGHGNAWQLGAVFSLGMILVDGVDGYLAAGTQALANAGESRGKTASRILGIIVVVFAFGLGGAELAGIDIDSFGLPLGVALFITVLSVRTWARSPVAKTAGIGNSGMEEPVVLAGAEKETP